MGEEVKRDVKWVLINSLIMLFWSIWSSMLAYMVIGTYFIPTPWYYVRNINILSFIVTIGLATLYTTNFWKAEHIFKATIVMFIVSIALFFISNTYWITSILGITP